MDRRTRLVVRVKAILGQFWVNDGVEDVVRALELEGWLDVLEPLTEAEIRSAWAEYQRSGPRSARGNLIKPDAGALYRIAASARQAEASRHVAAMRASERQAEEQEHARRQAMKPTAEEAARITREAGFRMNVVPKDQAL